MAVGIPLGPYRLLRRLASGGMAEIFLARQEGMDGFARDLVVKRILPHLAADPEFTRMFRDEAKLAALLSHPNVVHVYDFGSEPDQDGEALWLAMELVRGVDLRALILRAVEDARANGRSGAVPPHHAAKIASLVCEALAHAHALRVDGRPAGVVHRDVTPSNVLVSFDGAVKLADFGIAKARTGGKGSEPTEHGVVKGKLAYLSPEQARGEPLDARSDLFNVGILVFESVLGEPLFPHDDFRRAKMISAAGRIPEPERIDRLPAPIARVVRRALAARREDRYADALALRADLETYLRTCDEPSDGVEIGRYVRHLFPDALEEDARAPRAAGTVQGTSAIRPGTQALPAGTQQIDLDAAQTVIGPPPTVARARRAHPATGHPSSSSALVSSSELAPASELTPMRALPPSAATPASSFALAPPSVLTAPHHDAFAPGPTTTSDERRGRVRIALVSAAAFITVASMIGIALVATSPAREPPMPSSAAPDAPPIAPSVRAAPVQAELRVTTDPPGGALFVDARAIGPTPAILMLAPGAHRVEIRDPEGTILASETVALEEAEVREVTLALPAPLALAILRVDSSPSGAVVRIDGEPIGRTPLLHEVLPTRHRVDVELDGYASAGNEIVLTRPGEQATVAFALTRSRATGTRRPPPRASGESGTLTIATTPWSEVFLGGRRLGITPLANVRLPVGTHVLTLRAEGRPPQRTTVTIRAGEGARVRLVL